MFISYLILSLCVKKAAIITSAGKYRKTIKPKEVALTWVYDDDADPNTKTKTYDGEEFETSASVDSSDVVSGENIDVNSYK